MPPLTRMPTKQEFKDNLGLSWGIVGVNIGNEKSPFPALTRIGKLIEEYETVANDNATKLFIQFQIERASRFVIHNRFNKDKLGGELGNKQTDWLQSLREYVLGCVQNTIGANNGNYEQKLVEAFGKEVCATGQNEDQQLLGRDGMLYYRTALEQKMRKLTFRKGLAYRWNFTENGVKGDTRTLYDTKAFKDANYSEYFGSLYVMNAKNNIYVQGWEDLENVKSLKHSSLLAGAGVLCAGTIRINDGQVIWVTGKSGHYRPTVMNVVYMLERLSQYQVDLKHVKVFRENYTLGVQEDNSQWAAKMGLKNTHVPGRNYESCAATILLQRRAWPGPANEAQLMRVG